MRIFITGSTGFIGKHLVKRLSKTQHKIIVLVRNSKRAEFKRKNVKVVCGDITKPVAFIKELNKADVLVHLAALRANWGSEKEFYRVNSNCIKSFFSKNTKLKHIIVVSSVYAMGKLAKIPAKEEAFLNAKDLYGKSKKKLEQVTKRLSQKYGISYTIVRPSIVYGPGDNESGFLGKTIGLLKKGTFPVIGNGENLIHFVYIDDLIDGLIKIIKKGGNNQIYILAGKGSITLNRFLSLTRRALETEGKNIYIPRFLAYFLAYIVETLFKIGLFLNIDFFKNEPPIMPSKVQTISESWHYDIKKAKKELGFSPKIDYKEGIERALFYE